MNKDIEMNNRVAIIMYKHIFDCPQKCGMTKSFMSREKIPKDSTFEASCEYDGIQNHVFLRTKKQ